LITFLFATLMCIAIDFISRVVAQASDRAQVERQKAEESLRESEDRYRDLVENSQDLICTHDMEGRILTINPAAARLLGYDLKELIGNNVRDYLVPETRGLFADYLRQMKQQGAASGLMLMQTKSGEQRIWEYNNTVRAEGMAEPIARGMARDITESKRAEQEARRSDAILNAIAFSAERLLKGTNIESSIADVLERVGTATRSSRIYIFEREAPRDGDDEVYVSQRHEWVADGVTAQINNPELANFPLGKMGFGRWIDQFSHDKPIHGHVDEMSEGEQAVLSSQDILSIAVMPIFVNQTWWGFIGVDECRRRRRWSAAELEALRVAAGALGAAIQRQKAERDLQTQRDFAQQILNNMGQGLTVTNSDRHFVYVNPAYAQMVGRAPEELMGKAPRDFTVQEDHATLDQARARRYQGKTDSYETRLLHLDGHEIPVTITGVPRWSDGKVIGTIAVITDLSERKKAEEQLRKLSLAVEQSPVSIVITNLRGEIEYVNPKFKDVTGYSADEIIGQNPRILKSGYTSAEEYQTLWKTINEGGQWRGKFLNKKKNGELYWESAALSPIVNESGKVTHYLAVKEDITEREHREQELEAIAAISLALRAAPTRKEMLPIILDQLRSLFHSDSEAITLLDPLSNDMVLELGRGAFAAAGGDRLPAGQGVSGLVIQNRQPYLCNDAQHDPNFIRKEILQGVNAFACAPLSTHNAILGILWIGRATNIIASEEVRVLVAIADIAANAIHRATLHEQTTKQLQRLTALRTIDSGISNSFDMRVTLNIFIEQVISHLKVHAASILISKDLLTLEYAIGSGFRNRGITKSHLRVGESHAGRAALERRMVAVPDLSKDPFTASSVLSAEGFVSYYGVPLIAKGQLKGVLQIFHRAPLSPDEEWLDFLQTLAEQAAIAIDNAAMFDNLQRANSELLVAYNATIEGWSRALDLRDQETEGHTQRVTEMALNLATAMGVGETQLIHLQRGALLHDIGKMGIPDSILLKPGTLTDSEMEIMRRHPQYAYDMLSPIPFLRPALDIPYCHHEKWDGTGYPRKLKGEQIPLVARIFAVADVWDAVTSDRPYRAAWRRDEAIAYIREQSGKHFEPRAVEMFLKMIETP
jgi:PAS domain S-box-containing protein